MFESVSSVSLEKYPSPNHVLKAIWDPKLLFLSNDDEKLPNSVHMHTHTKKLALLKSSGNSAGNIWHPNT